MLKLIHISSVFLSFSLFFMRGIGRLRGSPIMQQRWVKIAPHSVDTVLLVSAVLLAIQLGYSPINSPWLTAKIIALLFYIGLGMVAFRFAKTPRTRLLAWLAALLTFAYIVGAAMTHDPLLGLYTWL
ncbi:MAG: SirB2 family protein [Sideroxydans sp.]|nr:SirB2 family protein [Sideroxydans sp.]